jgi:hypothetical protein
MANGGGGSPGKCLVSASLFSRLIGDVPPGNPNGGGATPGFCPNIGFEEDCPSAAYEFVMESITDCAFS